jgi:hypothetical protein
MNHDHTAEIRDGRKNRAREVDTRTVGDDVQSHIFDSIARAFQSPDTTGTWMT